METKHKSSMQDEVVRKAAAERKRHARKARADSAPRDAPSVPCTYCTRKSLLNMAQRHLDEVVRTSLHRRTRPSLHLSIQCMIRLSTYRPVSSSTENNISFTQLSNSGFYYTGAHFNVQCQDCGQILDFRKIVNDPGDERYHIGGCSYTKVSDILHGHQYVDACTERVTDSAFDEFNHDRFSGDDNLSNDVRNSTLLLTTESTALNENAHNGISQSMGNNFTSNNIEVDGCGELRPMSQKFFLEPSKHLFAAELNLISNQRTGEPTRSLSESSLTSTESVSSASSSSSSSQSSGYSSGNYLEYDDQTHANPEVDSPVFKVLSKPSYPVYIAYQKRLESLTEWKHRDLLDPNTVAAAGFFYAGYADCVRCFQCGLGLRSWKTGDDIHEQHRKHRPTCPFLQLLNNNNLRRYNGEGDHVQKIVTSNITTVSTEVGLLQSEHKKLAEQVTCRVCNTSQVQDLFLPCGELYACSDCSKLLTHCPSCHKQILATVTVYFT